jgi:drug/metabolite transporter (DMT)-like permease
VKYCANGGCGPTWLCYLWIFLGESLALLQLIGCGIILSGMLLAQSDAILGKHQASHEVYR